MPLAWRNYGAAQHTMRTKNQFVDNVTQACAVCGSLLTGPVMVRLGNTRLIRCVACHSWTHLPRLSAQGQAALHDSADYFSHPYFRNRRQATEALGRRCRETFTRINSGIDLASLRGQRMLDVGCDTADFLMSAKAHFGVIPVGIDVSGRAVEHATAKGVEAYHTDLESAPEELKNFSVITAIDLIEHLTSPSLFLREARTRLRPGGVVYLETPNIQSMVYQAGRILCDLTGGRPEKFFERLFPAHHVQYFTRTGLSDLAEKCGFEVVDIGLRRLLLADLGVSIPVRICVMALQLLDQLRREMVLIWVVLRKPC